MRCLAGDPADRPASAAEIAVELAATLPERETLPLPDHPSRRTTQIKATRIKAPPRAARARPRLALLLAAAAAVAVVVGVVALLSTGGGAPAKPAKPAPKVARIPQPPTAQQEAQELAAWLRRYSR
jgi:hypothetical protein